MQHVVHRAVPHICSSQASVHPTRATEALASPPGLEAYATAVIALFTIVAAVYAIKAYSQARYYERVRLTVAMMESPWLLAAVTSFNAFVAEFQSLDAARNEATMRMDYPHLAAAVLGPQNGTQIGNVIGSLTYIATLYAAKYYDEDVLFSRGYVHLLVAYFVFEPVLVRMVGNGIYKADIFKLGIAVAERLQRDPEFADCLPLLRDFTPGSA